jgi:hypothetical protein
VADQPKKKPTNNKAMNLDRGNRKASKQKPDSNRGHKQEWRGNHSRRSPQDALQRVLLGQGVLRNVHRRIDGSVEGRWVLPQTVGIPYDATQVRENKRLYPHLFSGK